MENSKPQPNQTCWGPHKYWDNSLCAYCPFSLAEGREQRTPSLAIIACIKTHSVGLLSIAATYCSVNNGFQPPHQLLAQCSFNMTEFFCWSDESVISQHNTSPMFLLLSSISLTSCYGKLQLCCFLELLLLTLVLSLKHKQAGCGSGQPGLVVGNPAHSRGVETRWSLWSFSVQAILWFYDNTGTLLYLSSDGPKDWFLCLNCWNQLYC